MTTEQIASLIISLAPSVISILTMIGVVIRTMTQFSNLKKMVYDNKAQKDLNQKVGELIDQNYELKKQLNEVLTKMDHVKRD